MNQHSVQPALRCPLCQETLHSVALLRTHLTHLHSVTADCTQKLISTVRPKKSLLLCKTNVERVNLEAIKLCNITTSACSLY